MTLRAATVPALDAVPDLVHGFEQRTGLRGAETREESRRRVASALHDRGRLFLMKQIHGATVVEAPWEGTPEADGSTATRPGLLLGIETADCLPVLLVDPVRRAVSAAHAGWRGTAAGVAAKAARALVAAGSSPADLVAALGPSIGPCCYEVGDELRDVFGPAGQTFFRPGPRGRPHLDVRGANVRLLLTAGLREDRIHHLSDCTACRPDLYHSYRRDGAGGGRMISFIGFAGRALTKP